MFSGVNCRVDRRRRAVEHVVLDAEVVPLAVQELELDGDVDVDEVGAGGHEHVDDGLHAILVHPPKQSPFRARLRCVPPLVGRQAGADR